jgi:electron transfer flavoprotein beta subunit
MKIIACCKAVPEGISKVRLAETGGKVECESHSLVINESDEYALEEALALKKEFSAEIIVVTTGGLRSQAILHIARAKGADRVMRIDADFTDSAIVSKVMAEAIKRMEYDLILTGVESSDNMSAQTGVFLAERLNLPYAFAVTRVEIEQEQSMVKVTKELGEGLCEILEMPLPAVLCIQSGIRPVNRVSIRKLLNAQKEPVASIALDSLGIDWDEETISGLRMLEVFKPPQVGNCEMIEGNPEEIARQLKIRIENVLR